MQSITGTAQVSLDPTSTRALKPLHGVNIGGVANNYWFDLTDWFRHWRTPTVRLHDVPLNTAYDTVDLHHLFPDPTADPNDPGSYAFTLTDDYIAKLRETGTDVYFRLGESIEHQPRLWWNDPRRWDPQTLATVCANVVRHYNQGWADGHEWGITYWEFWNEPHGPKNWNSTPEVFFDLYRQVAAAVKSVDPEVLIGLAGFSTGALRAESPWGAQLRAAAAAQVPIDFVSWHLYLDTWNQLTEAAVAARTFLDAIGLESAESHLGEWGYRPNLVPGLNTFSAYKVRRYDHVARIGKQQNGPAALAAVFGCLAALQDAPVDLAHYYSGGTSGRWGLFTDSGLPNQRGIAMELFAGLLRESGGNGRVALESDHEAVTGLATVDASGATLRVVLANLAEDVDLISVVVPGHWRVQRHEVFDVTETRVSLPLHVETEASSSRILLPITGEGVVTVDLAATDQIAAATQADPATAAGPTPGPAGDW